MKSRLNKKGWKIYHKWERVYHAELALRREERNDPSYEEGWCVIDCYDYVPFLEDEVGLLIFGYDENIEDYLSEFTATETLFTDVLGKSYTAAEVERALLPYYEDYKPLFQERKHIVKLHKIMR